jgi:hypothetical protein
MVQTQSTATLEGRLLAHRKILARLIAALPVEVSGDLTAWLEERSVLHDGQEDPGSIPTEGLQLELSLADEIATILDLSRQKSAGAAMSGV